MGAYIKATTGNWGGDHALLNALEVNVTLLGYLDDAGGGNYPDGHTYQSYPALPLLVGPLVGLYIDNVVANNPIMPGQYGVYKVAVSLPFSAPNTLEGLYASCDLIFQATQSDGQAYPIIAW
jgi:hypothetical protein